MKKSDLKEVVAYDFSNLNLQEAGRDNCYCDIETNCICNCDSDDCDGWL